ncbi:ABC transporter substrate-binding protein [Vibrio sp. 2017_1457_15]|nr:ABC transporter substrate-binding protein [Vibrio sp. 2017_1457_15]MDQ2160370.1 ABC transporter substrate-binding protein [Vibrio sp. 2017_1457_13]MDQ2189170.1 ABC transporter substrate-binding protein [Vibrio sp. A14(2019)]
MISAGSSVTELIFALGGQDQLIAVDVTSNEPRTRELPQVGYHRQLSAEGLLALNPTQLIGSEEMGPESTLRQLRSAGVKVNIINSDPHPQGLLERIDQIAQLIDRQSAAKTLKHQVNGTLEQLKEGQPAQSPLKVLFLLLHEGRAANVAGSNTIPDTLITLAGARNPAAEMISAYKPLSMEALITMQPDVILVSGRSYDQLGGAEAILEALPMLKVTPAGIHQRIITIDGHALVGGVGLKTIQEALRLQALLYPKG